MSHKLVAFKDFNEKWTMFNINLGYIRGGGAEHPPTEIPSQKPTLVRVNMTLLRPGYEISNTAKITPTYLNKSSITFALNKTALHLKIRHNKF